MQERRGGAIALFALGPILGPVIGPVVGGYLVAARGWRWVFWVFTMISGILQIHCCLALSETYPPVLLKRRTPGFGPDESIEALFLRALIRPTKIFLFSLIALTTSICTGIA